MTSRKKGLGKGLDALLDEIDLRENQTGSIINANLYDIDINPEQPRKFFDEEKLKELAASIKQYGIVQPLLVKKNGLRYTIIAGERRFRAARIAGLLTVPVLITDLDSDSVMEVSLIENIQRENLNPIEEAAAIQFLMEHHDLTQEEVSSRIGKSRSAIANSLRLLTLEKGVADLIKDGKLSPGHGKMLAGITDKQKQLLLAEKAAEKGWSVRRLEDELRFGAFAGRKTKETKLSPEFHSALQKMRHALKTKIVVEGNEEKGKVILYYYNQDDLDNIYRKIVGESDE